MSQEFLPECCGSGCAVCVLDYADELTGPVVTADLTGMLAAVDLADQLISAHCRKESPGSPDSEDRN